MPRGGVRTWSEHHDVMLTEFYAQYVGRHVPIAEIAALLGKSESAVRTRACVLGITDPNRPSASRVHMDTPCPTCGNLFRPQQSGGRVTRTCSTSCGQKLRIANGGHNRAMTGKKHTPETKAAVGVASRRMWENMPADQREERADRAALLGRQPPTVNTYSRTKKGRRADVGEMFFRSAWEANYARWLNYRSDVATWEYEPQRFDFPIKRGTTSYLPDFRVTLADGTVEWHEVKGWMTQRAATALKRFAKYYPDEVLVLIDEPAYRSIAKFAKAAVDGWE